MHINALSMHSTQFVAPFAFTPQRTTPNLRALLSAFGAFPAALDMPPNVVSQGTHISHSTARRVRSYTRSTKHITTTAHDKSAARLPGTGRSERHLPVERGQRVHWCAVCESARRDGPL